MKVPRNPLGHPGTRNTEDVDVIFGGTGGSDAGMKFMFVSATMVREIAWFGGDVAPSRQLTRVEILPCCVEKAGAGAGESRKTHQGDLAWLRTAGGENEAERGWRHLDLALTVNQGKKGQAPRLRETRDGPREGSRATRNGHARLHLALSRLFRTLISPGSGMAEISEALLSEARRLTGSVQGFVSSIDPRTGDNIGHTLEGEMLKKVGMQARQEIERLLDAKVFLELFVRVQKEWSENSRLLKEFGYE